jgi:hypothetical protein
VGVGVVWCGVVVSTLAPQKGGPTFLLLLLLLPLLSSPSPFGVRKNHVAHHDCICGVRGPPRAVSLSSAVWPSPGSSSGVSSSVGAVRNESLSSPSRLLPFLGYWGGSPAVMAGSPAFFSWTGEQSRGPSLVGPVRDESQTNLPRPWIYVFGLPAYANWAVRHCPWANLSRVLHSLPPTALPKLFTLRRCTYSRRNAFSSFGPR